MRLLCRIESHLHLWSGYSGAFLENYIRPLTPLVSRRALFEFRMDVNQLAKLMAHTVFILAFI